MIQNIIGKCAIIEDIKSGDKSFVEGMFIDMDWLGRPKRVRILTGEHANEVRMKGEYNIYEIVRHEEAAAILATVWAD